MGRSFSSNNFFLNLLLILAIMIGASHVTSGQDVFAGLLGGGGDLLGGGLGGAGGSPLKVVGDKNDGLFGGTNGGLLGGSTTDSSRNGRASNDKNGDVFSGLLGNAGSKNGGGLLSSFTGGGPLPLKVDASKTDAAFGGHIGGLFGGLTGDSSKSGGVLNGLIGDGRNNGGSRGIGGNPLGP